MRRQRSTTRCEHRLAFVNRRHASRTSKRGLADIAAAHYLAGRNGDAERFYAEALAKMTEIGRGESPSVFFLRNNWGIASNAAGDTRRALEQYDEALRIAVQRSIGGEPPPYLLLNRATALSSLARYPEALEAYRVAIESATRAGHTGVRVGALAYRADTYLLMGDVDRAEQRWPKSRLRSARPFRQTACPP